MEPVDCIRAIKAAPELSSKQKAWLFEKRGTPALWEGIKNEANVRGNLLMEKELSIPEPEIKRPWWHPERWIKGEIDWPAVKAYVDVMYEETGDLDEVKRYLKSEGLTWEQYQKWVRRGK